jgi:hypothetical protein
MPSAQVMAFQVMPPISAPKMIAGSTIIGSTMPLPTVSAT